MRAVLLWFAAIGLCCAQQPRLAHAKLDTRAVTAGLERVQLEARADNPDAIAFYIEQGYARAGTVPGYYRGAVDAVRLEKRLWVPAGAAP